MEFFDSYRLSRPPLVKDDYDPVNTVAPTPFRARLCDAIVLAASLSGCLTSLTALDADAPAARIGLGGGIVLAGFAAAQLGVFLPEARAAWARGSRRGIAVLALVGLAGAALIAWGVTGS